MGNTRFPKNFNMLQNKSGSQSVPGLAAVIVKSDRADRGLARIAEAASARYGDAASYDYYIIFGRHITLNMSTRALADLRPWTSHRFGRPWYSTQHLWEVKDGPWCKPAQGAR